MCAYAESYSVLLQRTTAHTSRGGSALQTSTIRNWQRPHSPGMLEQETTQLLEPRVLIFGTVYRYCQGPQRLLAKLFRQTVVQS